MKKSPAVIVAALVVALTAQTLPANASVSTTTLSGTIGGNPATQMANGDVVSVKTQAPISLIGPATQTVTTMWAPQGLSVNSIGDVTYPDGWSLQYTVDGETWTDTAPENLSTLAGVRSQGSVNSLGSGVFVSTAQAELVAAGSASGAGGTGDGYNVAFGNGTLINAYHHDSSSLTMACHKTSGEACSADVEYTNSSYQTNQGSNAFYNKKTNHAYVFVRKISDGSYGVACFDYSNLAAVDDCTTPYTKLTAGGTSNQGWGRSARVGNYLWSLDAVNGTLMCFNMTLNGGQGGACATDNNRLVGTAGGNGMTQARVSPADGKIFFTVNNKLGCYDPSSHELCGSSTPITITSTIHNPIPVENTDGTFYGVCDIASRKCLTTSGTETTTPTKLGEYWDSGAYPTYDTMNMADFAISKHRLYSIKGQTEVICYDFTTEAACAGFDGAHSEYGSLTYTVNIDPSNPRCLWVNQHSGDIVPVDPATGDIGCNLGQGVIIPITASVKRMSCDPEASVLTWDELTVTLPDGVAPADVKLTIRDSNGGDISGWTDVTFTQDGVFDISGIDTTVSGLDPVVNLSGSNGVTGTDLEATVADVTFTAAEPEVCIDFIATPNCEGITPDPSSPDVPDGLVASSSSTVPDGGGDTVSSDDDMTITGTNTGSMCPAVLPGVPTNPLTVYFTSISPKLLPAGKRDIQRLMAANTFTSVTCVGYTQGNKTITWLAKQRAAAVCAYVKSLYPRMKTKPSITKQTGKQYTYRSVLLTGH